MVVWGRETLKVSQEDPSYAKLVGNVVKIKGTNNYVRAVMGSAGGWITLRDSLKGRVTFNLRLNRFISYFLVAIYHPSLSLFLCILLLHLSDM